VAARRSGRLRLVERPAFPVIDAASRARSPLALRGWLPVWDIDRRRVEVDEIVAWTLGRLRAWGVEAPNLSAISLPGERARALAQDLTRESLSPGLRAPLHRALRMMLPDLPWDRIWVQTYAHFRVLVPGDAIAPVPPHTDHGFGHGLDERNVWIALTDAVGSNALHLWSLSESLAWHVRSEQRVGALPELSGLRPVDVAQGEALLFTPLHVHGAREARGRSRVSVDLRIVPRKGLRANLSFSPLWSEV
jgi:hypothetical protein